MRLRVTRIFKGETYTIGKLYIDGEYFCDTIEDTDRGLFQNMGLDEIDRRKVYCETAIPTGIYELTMDVKSPKYSNFKRYKWAEKYNGYLPRFKDVPGYTGVLIHVMNTAADSCGCIGVGENKVKGKVINSVKTFTRLMDEFLVPAKERKEKITITVE